MEIICKLFEYDGDVIWQTDKQSGQHRKPSSNKKLLDLGWKKEDYTSLEKGLKKTFDIMKSYYSK